MELVAREVLDDCETALEILEQEKDVGRWRVHWVGAVALVRAVGHVLKKVDAQDQKVAQYVDHAYRDWQSNREQHSVFWEFIDQERNNILKEYQFNVHPLEAVDVAVTATLLNTETGEEYLAPQVMSLGDNIYRPILDGYSEGDDARDVYREALNWWNEELSKIEEGIGK